MNTVNHILDQHFNIELFLNLGPNHIQTDLSPIDQVNQIVFGGQQSNIQQSQILLWKVDSYCQPPASTIISELGSTSQKKSAKEATAKYRERRKIYQQQLQAHVKSLEQQIKKTDAQIKSVKDAVLTKLESSIRTVHSTQNAQIYTQLQSCIHKEGQDQDLADIDKINLLLNTLKFRIGPTGRERQAKIQYNFKNIIHILFPGLHRYFLLTANQKKDLFGNDQNSRMNWTKQLVTKLNLSIQQADKIKQYESIMKQMYKVTLDKINRLQYIKKKMRQQAIDLDLVQNQIRQYISPVQCANFTMFCQKNKYRKQISLDGKFKPKNYGSIIEAQMEQLLHYKLGRKRIHRDPQFFKL